MLVKIPAKAAQYCLLHMYKLGHRQQIAQEAHCYRDTHVLHRVFGILQFHPGSEG